MYPDGAGGAMFVVWWQKVLDSGQVSLTSKRWILNIHRGSEPILRAERAGEERWTRARSAPLYLWGGTL